MAAKGSKGPARKSTGKDVRQKTPQVKKAAPQKSSRKTLTSTRRASRKIAESCSPSKSPRSPSPSSERHAEPGPKRVVKANGCSSRTLPTKHSPSAPSSAPRPRTSSATPLRTSTRTPKTVNKQPRESGGDDNNEEDAADNSLSVDVLTHQGRASNRKDGQNELATPSRGKKRVTVTHVTTDVTTPAKKKNNARAPVLKDGSPQTLRSSARKNARLSPSLQKRKCRSADTQEEKGTTTPSLSSDKCVSDASHRSPTNRSRSPERRAHDVWSPPKTVLLTPRARKTSSNVGPPETSAQRRNRASPSSKRSFRCVTDENVGNRPQPSPRSSNARAAQMTSSARKKSPAEQGNGADQGINADARKDLTAPHFNVDGTWTNRFNEVCTIAGAARDGAHNADGWKVVEDMLRKGIPPDSGADVATQGCTALLFAVEQLLKESSSSVPTDELCRMISLLITAGADVDHVADSGISPRKLLQNAISRYIDWRNIHAQPYQEVPLPHLHFLSTIMLGDPDFFTPYIEQEGDEKIQRRQPGYLVKRADGGFIEDQDIVVQPSEENGYMIGSGRYATLKEANAFVRTYWEERQGVARDYWDEYSVFKNQHGCLKVRTVDQYSVPFVVWVERDDYALKWIQVE